MFKNIVTIYLKEMKEVLRDRKTLVFMLILPTVLVPLLINFMTSFMMKAEKKARTETLTYALFGSQYLPEFADFLKNNAAFEEKKVDDLSKVKQAIDEGRIKLALEIPSDAEAKLESGEQLHVVLHFNNASLSSKVKTRTKKAVVEFGEILRDRRLIELGFEGVPARTALVTPIALDEKGTADMRETIGERVGGFLPYLFIIFAFIGALYPAIDLGAGEKERGTLETLLLTPVPRNRLVIGKFLVIFTTGLTAALLSLGSITVWLLTKGQAVTGVLGAVIKSVGSMDIVLIGAMLIPTTAIFAALLMCISIYAKSFKEAQSYATPLNFLAIIPAVMAMLPGIELTWTTALIPITNVSLAIKELIKGTMDYTMLFAIIGSSTAIALLAVFFCTVWFEKESVLFRE
jgi:sodium transport system permease protein